MRSLLRLPLQLASLIGDERGVFELAPGGGPVRRALASCVAAAPTLGLFLPASTPLLTLPHP